MKTIQMMPGESIDYAARTLVAVAPACAMFNDIKIRARYATTRPADIVSRFGRLLAERAYAYRMSPMGKADDVRSQADIAEKQTIINRMLDEFPDFTDCAAVLTWIDAFAWAADRVGVTFEFGAMLPTFALEGWPAGVNCGDAFDSEDPRNVAGWIVGQALDCYQKSGSAPGVLHKFVADWRARFGGAS